MVKFKVFANLKTNMYIRASVIVNDLVYKILEKQSIKLRDDSVNYEWYCVGG